MEQHLTTKRTNEAAHSVRKGIINHSLCPLRKSLRILWLNAIFIAGLILEQLKAGDVID